MKQTETAVAEYIADITRVLADMAAKVNLQTLSQILKMTELEAQQQCSSGKMLLLSDGDAPATGATDVGEEGMGADMEHAALPAR